jgi:hypothetical protein
MPPSADHHSRGQTPREFARRYRLGPDRVRTMIASGQLGALNLAPTRSGKPRYVITPAQAEAWERRHLAVAATPEPQRRRKPKATVVDYYP